MTVENVVEHLKEHDIKPSLQRIKIFQYLLENRIHPTVDEIFQGLSNDIPTLSKTTVYNTLKLFLESDLVQEIVIEENEVRYDVNTETHGHFKCKTCGKVVDFDVDLSKLDLHHLQNVRIEETHFYLKGTCESCLLKENQNN